MSLITIHELYGQLSEQVRTLEAVHSGRLRCGRGCSQCCVDDLTVFEVEADNIRRKHSELLANEPPHLEGQCAFLDEEGACRIYEDRPYVCRTQGLPLRWIDDDAEVEMRDICPLNNEGPPIEGLPPEQCWTLGPVEAQLAKLQDLRNGNRRVPLRSLFSRSKAKTWVLSRIDDNGVEFEMNRFKNEMDAELEKEILESKNHKQSYVIRCEGGE